MCECVCISLNSHVCFFSVCLLLSTDLEVYVLNTEADMQDLTFPHSYDSDSILQISALALQQYSSNGLLHTTKISKNIFTILCRLLSPHFNKRAFFKV